MQHSKSNKASRWAQVLIALVFVGFLTSCSDDENVIDSTARVPFLGSYQVKDQNNEESQYFSFILTVQESSKGPDKIDLKNFRYINNGLSGTIQGNKLVISQVLEDSDEKVEVNGEGTLNGDKLNYSYKIVLKKKGEGTKVYENTAEATRIQ